METIIYAMPSDHITEDRSRNDLTVMLVKECFFSVKQAITLVNRVFDGHASTDTPQYVFTCKTIADYKPSYNVYSMDIATLCDFILKVTHYNDNSDVLVVKSRHAQSNVFINF